MQGNSKKKIGAATAAVIIVGLMAIFIVSFILLMRGEESAGGNAILLAYIGIFAAIIIGVLVSLKQRFKEIKSGEEEEARKY